MNFNNLTVKNPIQIMNMGGPFIGDLYWGESLIATDVLYDNYIYNEELDALFFVKHSVFGRYNLFKINFYKTKEGLTFEFFKDFSKLYLGKFISPYEIEIFEAFHGEIDTYKQIFDINEEDFGIADS